MMASEVENYHSIPIPSRSIHSWRYTPWRKIHPTGNVKEIPSDVLPATISLSMFDGSDVPEGIRLELSKIEVQSRQPTQDIAEAFHRVICPEYWILKVDDSTVLSSPLMVEVKASGHVAASNISVEIGNFSEIQIIWSFTGEASWFGLRRHGEIGDGAKYCEVVEQSLSSSSVFLRGENWSLGKDASMYSGLLSLGGLLVRSDLRSRIERGSTIKKMIASHGKGERVDDHHLEVTHPVGENNSVVILHSACDDSSRSISTGMLTIEKGADGSDASQIFRNLLLSPKAKAESIPELEVLADDVSAAHGAASAPVDAEQMFYLQSRGLEQQEAEHLVVEGFLIDAMQELDAPGLVDWLRTRLTIHLDCALLD